jgi:hypothetical protein
MPTPLPFVPASTIIIDTEDVFNWRSIETTYLGEVLQEREVILDNGIINNKMYDENGVMTSFTQMDGGPGNGVKKWTSKETEFDETGAATKKTVVFDNDRTREVIFNENGSKTATLTDTSSDGSAFVWASKQTVYDTSGDKRYNITVFDNFDLTINIFLDGHKASRVDIDSDSSHSWYARQFVYDCDGNKIDTIFYDTQEELQEGGGAGLAGCLPEPL